MLIIIKKLDNPFLYNSYSDIGQVDWVKKDNDGGTESKHVKSYELYLEVLNCFEEEGYKYDFTYGRRYVSILDWKKIDNWKVVNNILSKASMQGIYDSLTDEDIENYSNGSFLDKLIEKIDNKIKSKNEFDAYSVIPYDYFRIFRLDIEPLYKCKYWYLEKGEELTIELPYGATLKYEPARLERKDIKEWETINIKKLEHDPENENTLFAYYIDTKDEKQAVFTTIYDDGLYNKSEIIDNVRYGDINIYTKTNNIVVENKNVVDRLAIAGISFAIEKTAINYRTNEIYTESFLKIIKSNGIIPEYNVREAINVTKDYIEDNRYINDKYLFELKCYDGNSIFGIFKLKWQGDKVDDIEYYIIPEDKMDLSYEEMYQLAFND